MGTKDITEKALEDYNDVFADIVNVLLFDGTDYVRPDIGHRFPMGAIGVTRLYHLCYTMVTRRNGTRQRLCMTGWKCLTD
jgi:hypothetical protein